jgi:hypothetical protein
MILSQFNFQRWLSRRPQAIVCLVLFLTSILIYWLNGQTNLASNDNIPHTILSLNWLQNQTLHLDTFRDGYLYSRDEAKPYFFIEAPNGHLTSTYPIGVSIVSFPLYCLFFIYLKLSALFHSVFTGTAPQLLNVTDPAFDEQRQLFGKLAATIATTFSVVVFYLAMKLRTTIGTALIATFTYAFATSTWVLNSQDLRQHTISNLLLVSILFCFFKANRTQGAPRRLLLITAGFLCGLLPSVRLTSAIFVVAAIVYAIYEYRKEAWFLLLGLPSALINLLWNFYYFGFGNLSGGYSQQFESGASDYIFTVKYFVTAFFGLLISPSDGLFTYSPVLLFAIPGLFQVLRFKAGRDEKLLLCFTSACLILFLHYCVYSPWSGGSGSYSSRFMTDVLPVVCFLVGYFLSITVERSWRHRKQIYSPILVCFLVLLSWSTFVQAVGAFTKTDWGTVPLPVVTDRSRLWNLRDSQIERHTRNLVAQIAPPIQDPETYLKNAGGRVNQITDRQGQPLAALLIVQSQGRRVLKAQLQNTGQSPWYGYEAALPEGETRLRVQFINPDKKNSNVKTSALYVSGTIQPGETATAIGMVSFPAKPGKYLMAFELIAARLGDFHDQTQQPFTLPVEVIPKPS